MRRRDFLKATALAAGVSVLEACGTPEEQFLVQPVRRSSRDPLPGESVWRNSVCGQCGAGCGLQVRVVDGDAKKLEGIPAHPVNAGGVCALGHSLLQEIYNPDRILTPQRRTEERGEGLDSTSGGDLDAGSAGGDLDAGSSGGDFNGGSRGSDFDAVSWEDALGDAGGALATTAPERVAIACGGGAGDLTVALWRRLAAALGAPPPALIEPAALVVERQAARAVLGIDGLPYFDIGRADLVLSIGAPFLDRWHSPVHYTGRFAAMRRDRGGRLVQAEPRMSLTAAAADEWLPVRPGTEGMLARTIAGVLLDEDLVESEDAERYRRVFEQPPPVLEEGAAACDVAADRIRRTALELAAAGRRVVLAGGSAAAHDNGLFNVAAALALNLLLGNAGAEGGVFAPASLELSAAVAPADAPPSTAADLAARLRGENGEPVEVLVVAEADPLHTLPAAWGLREALARVERIIVLSSFRDDTARHADLLLPLNTELERFQATVPAPIGIPALSLAEPAVEPLGDGRHPGDIVLALATALGEPVAGQFPWPSFTRMVRELIDEQRERLPGGAGTTTQAFIDAALGRGGIFADGTAPADASMAAGLVLGEQREPEFDGDAAEYPFLFLPFESVKSGDGRGANRPWLQELPDPLSTVMWESWLELSPVDAAALGIGDGDRLRVVSSSGVIEGNAVIDPAVRPGVVSMPLGQGHDDYGRYAAGRGANPMELISDRLVTGAPAAAWASSRVRIERVGAGELPRFGRSHQDRGEGENIPVAWAPMESPGRNLE